MLLRIRSLYEDANHNHQAIAPSKRLLRCWFEDMGPTLRTLHLADSSYAQLWSNVGILRSEQSNADWATRRYN